MVQTTLEDVNNAGPEEIAVFFFLLTLHNQKF